MSAPKPASKTVLHEVQDFGYQKRLALLDTSGKTRCFLAGGVPYAQHTQRFSRARPLDLAEYQFGPRESPADFARYSNECPQPMKASNVSENCYHSNIYIPNKELPSEGFPVPKPEPLQSSGQSSAVLYISSPQIPPGSSRIAAGSLPEKQPLLLLECAADEKRHGGFLAWGQNASIEPSALLSDTPLNAVVILPNYRLNAFGFLASKELSEEARARGEECGNLGFWDQRLAIEWTHRNCRLYGGNPRNITLSGLSAGSYSTFHQLAYEVALPDDRVFIRRATMFSNGCGLQPKPVREVQSHYENLLAAVGIPHGLPPSQQLGRLRALPAEEIVGGVKRVPENSFRAVTDGQFVRESLFDELRSGSFANTLRRRGIRIMIGEVCDEKNSYRQISPPSSFDALIRRLAVEYPVAAASKLAHYYCPERKLPFGSKSWQDVFGDIYADFQVHSSERALIGFLYPALSHEDLYRYRIEYRTKETDKVYRPSMGVCHGSDQMIWFAGNGLELTEEEKVIVADWVDPWIGFIRGDDRISWGTGEIGQMRLLSPDGQITVAIDKNYKHSRRTFDAVIQEPRPSRL